MKTFVSIVVILFVAVGCSRAKEYIKQKEKIKKMGEQIKDNEAELEELRRELEEKRIRVSNLTSPQALNVKVEQWQLDLTKPAPWQVVVLGENNTTAKPDKEFTKEDVVGTYEAGDVAVEAIITFLDDSRVEGCSLAKWSMSNGELHINYENGGTAIFRINKDKSITRIAVIADGLRTDFPKEEQATYKKNK